MKTTKTIARAKPILLFTLLLLTCHITNGLVSTTTSLVVVAPRKSKRKRATAARRSALERNALWYYTVPGDKGNNDDDATTTDDEINVATNNEETKSSLTPSDNATTSSQTNSSNGIAIVCMSLLAIQFGIQPGLVRKYTPLTTCRSTVVLLQEVLKVVLSGWIFFGPLTSKHERDAALEGWSLSKAFRVGGLPAALYGVQNIAALKAYQHLSPLTFNVLNQTKTLSAAMCCYLLMNTKQSKIQMASLVVLSLSALIMEQVISIYPPFFVWSSSAASSHLTQGVLPILLASFLSGLAGALTQKNLQQRGNSTKGRNPYLFTMELCSFSAVFVLLSILLHPNKSLSSLLTTTTSSTTTLIPIVTNALGGILVGLVTKYAGVVRKGFALMFGIFLSGVCSTESIGSSQIMGGGLAALSLYWHTKYPYPKNNKSKQMELKRGLSNAA